MKKLLEGLDLENRAKKLGCDIQGDLITQSSLGRHPRDSDAQLQKRVIEAERALRESRLWVIAVISGIASVISAITALIAVFGEF